MGRKKKYAEGSNPHGVTTGQIWENLDPRHKGKTVIVLMVKEEFGYAIVRRDTNRFSRIRLTRFKPISNGYRLVGNCHTKVQEAK